MNKCDYCDKPIEYGMNVILDKETIEIQTCDDHKHLGLTKQKMILYREEAQQRTKSMAEHKWYPLIDSNPNL